MDDTVSMCLMCWIPVRLYTVLAMCTTAVLHTHCKQRLSIGGGLPLGLLVPVLGNEVSCVDHYTQTVSVGQQHHLTDNDRERGEREVREVMFCPYL